MTGAAFKKENKLYIMRKRTTARHFVKRMAGGGVMNLDRL